MSRKIVLLDVDGVLADFEGMLIAAAESVVPRSLNTKLLGRPQWDLVKELGLTKEEETKLYDEVIDKPRAALNLEPKVGAVYGVRKLDTIANVYFCTSPVESSPTWDYDRRLWLTKYFGKDYMGVPFGRKAIFAKFKYLVRGDVFVDDKPSNVKDWAKAWPMSWAVLWDSWSDGKTDYGIKTPPFLVSSNWDELCNIVESKVTA